MKTGRHRENFPTAIKVKIHNLINAQFKRIVLAHKYMERPSVRAWRYSAYSDVRFLLRKWPMWDLHWRNRGKSWTIYIFHQREAYESGRNIQLKGRRLQKSLKKIKNKSKYSLISKPISISQPAYNVRHSFKYLQHALGSKGKRGSYRSSQTPCTGSSSLYAVTCS